MQRPDEVANRAVYVSGVRVRPDACVVAALFSSNATVVWTLGLDFQNKRNVVVWV